MELLEAPKGATIGCSGPLVVGLLAVPTSSTESLLFGSSATPCTCACCGCCGCGCGCSRPELPFACAVLAMCCCFCCCCSMFLSWWLAAMWCPIRKRMPIRLRKNLCRKGRHHHEIDIVYGIAGFGPHCIRHRMPLPAASWLLSVPGMSGQFSQLTNDNITVDIGML